MTFPRRSGGASGRSESKMRSQSATNNSRKSAKPRQQYAVWKGGYDCPKCKQIVWRDELDKIDTLRLPGVKSWKEGGKLKCSHCGYEANPTPKRLKWIDPIYRNTKAIPLSVRRQALELAGHKCEECGSTENLEFHHKRERWFGGPNAVDNLRVLCRHCHMELEFRLPISEVTKRWLTPTEAAEKVGVKPATVVKWCREKTLRHSKKVDGKWLISDIDLLRRKGRDRGWMAKDGRVYWKRKDPPRVSSMH